MVLLSEGGKVMKKGEKYSLGTALSGLSGQAFSDLKFRALFENSGTSIVIVDIEGIYHMVNSQAAKYLGATPEEIIGQSIHDFLPPETAEKYLERNRRVIEAGLDQEYEDTFSLPDGDLTFLITDKVLKDQKGKGYALLSNSIDITARKQAEEALRVSENNYRLLVKNLPGISAFLFNHDLRFILAEGALHPEFDLTSSQLEGKTLWEILPQEMAELLAHLYKSTLEGKSTENRISEYKGRTYSVNIFPVRNNQGAIIAGMMVSQDITERKRADEALQTNYSLLRMAGKAAKFGGWSLDISNNKVIWSDEVAAIHEMPAGYSLGLDEAINFYAPEWRNKIAKVVADCEKNGIPYDEEMELITAKGKRIWVRAIGEAVRDEKGKIFKVQGAFQNINERKQADEALRKSEAKYRALVDDVKDGFYICDIRTNFILANPALARILGFEAPNEIIGRSFLEFVPQGRASALLDQFRSAMATGIDSDAVYTEIVRPDGSIRLIEIKPQRIMEDGKVTGNQGIVRDITERKQAESKLEESYSLLAATLESTADGILVVDKTGKVTSFNKKFTELWHIPEPILATREDDKLIAYVLDQLKDPVGFLQKVEELYRNEDETSFDTIEFKDGRTFERYSQSQQIEGKTIGRVWSFRNVTERKQAEQALKESELRLTELNATKDRFFSIIAHDLKGPFNSILGFSAMLSTQIQEKDYFGIEKYARIIQRSSEQAMDLLQNLLDWSRSQVGRMEFSPENIDIVELINQSTDLLSNYAQQKSIPVYLQVPDKLVVRVDKEMIHTVLRNLISNAIKFTQTGGKVVITARRTTRELLVSVADNGIGVDNEALDHLFRIDKTYSSPGTQNEKGTGLGLILCKELIDKHNGRIWVESEKDKGSNFQFSIPQPTG